jgi:putative glutathione S-transferase
MGQLIDGAWHDEWYDTASTGGRFKRTTTAWRNWITPDGAPGPSGEGGFPAESGRYHLYVSLACPWAHRTLIFRALKGLAPHIDISVVHPDMLSEGWTFATDFPATTGDNLFGLPYLRDIYLRADPQTSGRVTVPILWDKQRGTIVSNESAEIIRMFNSAFNGLTGDTDDYCPEGLLTQVDELNARIYDSVNNGVYKAGFATSQQAYDEALKQLSSGIPPEFDAAAADRRGDIYALQGKKAEAIEEYTKAYRRFDEGQEYRRIVEVKLNALGVDPAAGAPAQGGAK